MRDEAKHIAALAVLRDVMQAMQAMEAIENEYVKLLLRCNCKRVTLHRF